MNKWISFLLTIAVLGMLNFIIHAVFGVLFIDYAFVTGLIGAAGIYFFNSSGGYTSRNLEMKVQSQTGIKLKQEENQKFSPTSAFYAAILYTVLAGIATFYYYKEYFM
ncbi:succinate dehydrogenase/fumarate reductase flavoprotein subunit [Bacillus ectoiniformans]|uniref:hypothetical protein n=1 Tax=Bacillus ectoiniformans TaxID=1494429 RepID=UPI001956AEF4|nr:hypothetical protein [Bacillus ectoiniformans]MBM7647845.1 succinate dehydrogenase/fumarate reductase flavoprotein subunit [Bacillus ectoiniformans]